MLIKTTSVNDFWIYTYVTNIAICNANVDPIRTMLTRLSVFILVVFIVFGYFQLQYMYLISSTCMICLASTCKIVIRLVTFQRQSYNYEYYCSCKTYRKCLIPCTLNTAPVNWQAWQSQTMLNVCIVLNTVCKLMGWTFKGKNKHIYGGVWQWTISLLSSSAITEYWNARSTFNLS